MSQVHTVSNVATFDSGYTGIFDSWYAGLVKAINAKITPSNKLVVGTQYTVATISDGFRPKAFTSAFAIAHNSIAYCDITQTGKIIVRPTTGDVPAGTNIWLRCVYI